MNNLLSVLFVVLFLMPLAALAQLTVPEAPAPGDSPIWGYVVLAIPAVASAVSAFVPSSGPIMRIVDFLAFNWLRARNDPGAQ